MTIKEMKIIQVKKALSKYKTVKEAAFALGVTERTIENYKKKQKDGKKTLGT